MDEQFKQEYPLFKKDLLFTDKRECPICFDSVDAVFLHKKLPVEACQHCWDGWWMIENILQRERRKHDKEGNI